MDQTYLFERGSAEDDRLRTQGELADLLTRNVFTAMGLAPGQRVLDLGSGAGNVALLAAEFVGQEGFVVGIDRDAATAERAQVNARRLGVSTVEFRAGDVQTLDGVEDGFDLAVGRLVFMYLADPVEALRQAYARVRPGGLVCVQEADLEHQWAAPEPPLWEQVRTWVVTTMRKAGVEARMAHRLFGTFRAAGLPAPELTLDTMVRGGPETPVHVWANITCGVLPLMEKLGVATRAEVDPETLRERLLADLVAHDAVMLTPPLMTAWTRKPGQT